MFKNINIDIIRNNYMINKNGKIKSLLSGKILKSHKNRKNGYFIIRLVDINGNRKTYHIHRLVALTFLDKPKNYKTMQVNHKDGNKENNNVSNLEWVTYKENMEHAVQNNLVKKGKEHHNYGKKLNDITRKKISKSMIGVLNHQSKKIGQYDKNGILINTFNSIREAANRTNGSESGISKNINRKSKSSGGFIWKQI